MPVSFLSLVSAPLKDGDAYHPGAVDVADLPALEVGHTRVGSRRAALGGRGSCYKGSHGDKRDKLHDESCSWCITSAMILMMLSERC